MRYFLIFLSFLFFISCNQNAQEVTSLDTEQQKISYTIGSDIGKNLQRSMYDFDQAALMQGMKDALAKKELLLDEKEVSEMLKLFQKIAGEAQKKSQTEKGETNTMEGEKFLAENKEKEGIVVLPSGLQYKVLEEGKGKKPLATNKVKVHYRGTLIDGTEFDSSYKRGEPIEFPVNGVIKGWTEALQLMAEGSKWMLYIPSELAYGARGAGGQIGPNATLIFEVELLEVK